jgi:hypothetical protein
MGLLGALCVADQAAAQISVQLPTYSTYSVNTTVVVPDRGGMWIGGGGQSSFGGLRSAPAGQMLRTVRQGAAGVGVLAHVHDHAELDQQTLAKAAPLLRPSGGAAKPAPAWQGEAGVQSIAALRRERAAEKQQLAAEAAKKLEVTKAIEAAKLARLKQRAKRPSATPSQPSSSATPRR